MYSVTKVRLFKHWRPVLCAVAVGGGVLAVSYWWWRRRCRKSISSRGDEHLDMADPTLQNIRSRYVNHLPSEASISSQLSITANDKRSFISSYARSPSRSALNVPESDPANSSISNLDCGRLGFRALVDVVDYLENLMFKVGYYEEHGLMSISVDASDLIDELRTLLEQAYRLREQYKRKLILQSSDLIDVFSDGDDDTASFVSAVEQVDLTELDHQIAANRHRPLYCTALSFMDREEEIPHRFVVCSGYDHGVYLVLICFYLSWDYS